MTDRVGAIVASARRGDEAALCAYGKMLLFGEEGLREDFDEAKKTLEKASRRGAAEADYLLGLMAEYGAGQPVDYGKASRFYLAAAEKDHLKGLETCVRWGFEGRPGAWEQDPALALRCSLRAKELGSRTGVCGLAAFFILYGSDRLWGRDDYPQNVRKGLSLFRRANASAERYDCLAYCYRTGAGGYAIDRAKERRAKKNAFEAYRLRAEDPSGESGPGEAAYSYALRFERADETPFELARRYAEGRQCEREGEESFNMAFGWYLEAYERGCNAAFFRLRALARE